MILLGNNAPNLAVNGQRHDIILQEGKMLPKPHRAIAEKP